MNYKIFYTDKSLDKINIVFSKENGSFATDYPNENLSSSSIIENNSLDRYLKYSYINNKFILIKQLLNMDNYFIVPNLTQLDLKYIDKKIELNLDIQYFPHLQVFRLSYNASIASPSNYLSIENIDKLKQNNQLKITISSLDDLDVYKFVTLIDKNVIFTNFNSLTHKICINNSNNFRSYGRVDGVKVSKKLYNNPLERRILENIPQENDYDTDDEENIIRACEKYSIKDIKENKLLYRTLQLYLNNPSNLDSDKTRANFAELMNKSMPISIGKPLYRGGFIKSDIFDFYIKNSANLSLEQRFELGMQILAPIGIDDKEVIDRSCTTVAQIASKFVKAKDAYAENMANLESLSALFIIKCEGKPIKGICSDQLSITFDLPTPFEHEILLDHKNNNYRLDSIEIKVVDDYDNQKFNYCQVVITASGK